MDISNWPINRIMQLPDNCFGRRWPIGFAQLTPDAEPHFEICETGLPEVCVIWSISTVCIGTFSSGINIQLRLGDNMPATDAEFLAFEPLIDDITGTGAVRNSIVVPGISGPHRFPIRKVVASAGRRLVGRFQRIATTAMGGQVIVVVSSMPTEVPDWLVSR